MESQPQNPEFRNNPENFHPCSQGPNEDVENLDFQYFAQGFQHLQRGLANLNAFKKNIAVIA